MTNPTDKLAPAGEQTQVTEAYNEAMDFIMGECSKIKAQENTPSDIKKMVDLLDKAETSHEQNALAYALSAYMFQKLNNMAKIKGNDGGENYTIAQLIDESNNWGHAAEAVWNKLSSES